MKTYETLVEAMNVLRAKGYTQDFNVHPEKLECREMGVSFGPDEFHVDEVHRFEGMTNPDDNAVLYAISSKHNLKGLLVDAYGMYSSLSSEMVDKFRIDEGTEP